jgi:hypothetical protein
VSTAERRSSPPTCSAGLHVLDLVKADTQPGLDGTWRNGSVGSIPKQIAHPPLDWLDLALAGALPWRMAAPARHGRCVGIATRSAAAPSGRVTQASHGSAPGQSSWMGWRRSPVSTLAGHLMLWWPPSPVVAGGEVDPSCRLLPAGRVLGHRAWEILPGAQRSLASP